MVEVVEDRCIHEMLILNGQLTCSLCKGVDDTVEMKVALSDVHGTDSVNAPLLALNGHLRASALTRKQLAWIK